jgi:YVTN family beta-propeller protein
MSDRYSLCLLLLAIGASTASLQAADKESYRGPLAVVASSDGRSLFVANADAREVAVVDADRGALVRTIPMPAEPTGLLLSADGAALYVTCGGPRGTVQIINARSGQARGTISVGHTPTGPAISPDGTRLYVCNRFNNDVSVIDVAGQRELARVAVTREPIAAAVTPDGRTVFVANHLPADASDAEIVSAVVTAIDTRTRETAAIRLPNGSSGVRGLCISPDGKYVYVTHTLARFQLPTTQVERGWITTNALSIIDAAARKRFATVLLDEVDRGAANPWGVTTTSDGRLICVTHAGAAEMSVIDAPALMTKLTSRLADVAASKPSDPANSLSPSIGVSEDLTFLSGLRRRVALRGLGPRGLTVSGERAYVCEYFTDTIGVVALQNSPDGKTGQIALGPAPILTAERRGEILFNSADLCLQRWLSCATCHPDARVDGLNWDLINDGLGNPKNARSMLLAHRTPPSMTLAVRPTAEEAVRAGIRHILFTEPREADAQAIDAYLKALEPVPSPYNAAGGFSESARRGERLFFDPKVGCGVCHPTPRYTDLKSYDVRSRTAFDQTGTFDTPTLIECWRTAPYGHDGHYPTIRGLLEGGKHGASHGTVGELTPEQIADLVAFVLSL